MEPIYKRVLIKLSGEAVYGSDIAEYETLENGDKKVKHVPVIDKAKLLVIAEALKKCHDMGVEIGIVFGGGNIWRGGQLGEGFDRARADHMGMLATVINSIALSETLEGLGVPTAVMSSVEMPQFCESYIKAKAVKHLSKKRVVIFAGGTGISHMTTDTTSVLRGVEIDADVVLLAKNAHAHAKMHEQLLEGGFQIINSSWRPMYVVTPAAYWSQKEVYDWTIYRWTPVHPDSPYRGVTIEIPANDNVLGGQLLAWGDTIAGNFPTVAEGIAEERRLVAERMAALADNTWNREKMRSYAEFSAAYEALARAAGILIG